MKIIKKLNNSKLSCGHLVKKDEIYLLKSSGHFSGREKYNGLCKYCGLKYILNEINKLEAIYNLLEQGQID